MLHKKIFLKDFALLFQFIQSFSELKPYHWHGTVTKRMKHKFLMAIDYE